MEGDSNRKEENWRKGYERRAGKQRGGRAKEKSEGAFGLQISEGFVFQLDQLLRMYKTNRFYWLQEHYITDTAS